MEKLTDLLYQVINKRKGSSDPVLRIALHARAYDTLRDENAKYLNYRSDDKPPESSIFGIPIDIIYGPLSPPVKVVAGDEVIEIDYTDFGRWQMVRTILLDRNNQYLLEILKMIKQGKSKLTNMNERTTFVDDANIERFADTGKPVDNRPTKVRTDETNGSFEIVITNDGNPKGSNQLEFILSIENNADELDSMEFESGIFIRPNGWFWGGWDKDGSRQKAIDNLKLLSEEAARDLRALADEIEAVGRGL